jgi:hypothetical protein
MIITQIALTRIGVKIFEKKVNEIAKGGKIVSVSIEKRGFRFVCVAVIELL